MGQERRVDTQTVETLGKGQMRWLGGYDKDYKDEHGYDKKQKTDYGYDKKSYGVQYDKGNADGYDKQSYNNKEGTGDYGYGSENEKKDYNGYYGLVGKNAVK